MTHKTAPAYDRFRPNDLVRLIASHGDHAAGASGHIVGRFARTDPTWLVSFSGKSPCAEVRGDEIVRAAA